MFWEHSRIWNSQLLIVIFGRSFTPRGIRIDAFDFPSFNEQIATAFCPAAPCPDIFAAASDLHNEGDVFLLYSVQTHALSRNGCIIKDGIAPGKQLLKYFVAAVSGLLAFLQNYLGQFQCLIRTVGITLADCHISH